MNKNQPSDPKVGCISPTTLVELIETYINLDKELEGFKIACGILKNDEFVHFH